MKYYIENITNRNGVIRTEDRYPNRIGSTVDFLRPVEKGMPMLFEYGKGTETHITLTSRVKDSQWNDNKFYVKTHNSIYIFKPLKESEE